jgi:sulfur-oxidizing protein SoxY
MDELNPRRRFLRSSIVSLLGLAVWAQASLARAFTLLWNEKAFASPTVGEALKASGYEGAVDHPPGLVLTLPELAENGAVVPIEIESHLPGTERIAIYVDNNPNPMVAEFLFMGDTPAYISTRIKMASTSLVRVMAKTPSGIWQATQPVKVTLGGCGG